MASVRVLRGAVRETVADGTALAAMRCSVNKIHFIKAGKSDDARWPCHSY